MSFLLGKNDRAIVGGKKPKVVVFGWLQKIMNSVATFKSPTFPKYDVFDTCLVLISILSEFRANFETLSFLGYFRPMLSSECPKTLINRILPLSKIPPETKEAPRYIHCLPFLYYSNCFSFTLLKKEHVCLYILLGKVRTLLEWANRLLSKILEW